MPLVNDSLKTYLLVNTALSNLKTMELTSDDMVRLSTIKFSKERRSLLVFTKLLSKIIPSRKTFLKLSFSMRVR